MHDHEQLLRWVNKLYTWLSEPYEGRAQSAELTKLSTSHTAVGNTWWQLLPLERVALVDFLFFTYCGYAATGSFVVDSVVYHNLMNLVNARQGVDQSQHAQHLAVHARIATSVWRIVDVYRRGSSGGDAHAIGQAEAAEVWARMFTSPMGVSQAKVVRLGFPALESLRRALDEHDQELQTILEEGAGLPLVHAFLPSAEAALYRAQFAVETTTMRFGVFRYILSSFVQLYRAGDHRDAAQMAEAVGATERDHASMHFATLSVEQQAFVVSNARQELFKICNGHALHGMLPGAEITTHMLFQPLLHPELYPEAAEAGAAPTELRSLARTAMSRRQREERRMRRY
ncbi:hypothetical protein JCM10450v2_006525 [Rhodotorula kratochvilovae]